MGSNSFNAPGGDVGKGPTDEIRPLRFRNDSDETIPSCAVLRITGAVEVGNGIEKRFFITVDKPDSESTSGLAINLQGAVNPGGYGSCSIDYPLVVLLNPGETPPEPGDYWLPEADSWELTASSGSVGFRVIAKIKDQDRALCILDSTNTIRHFRLSKPLLCDDFEEDDTTAQPVEIVNGVWTDVADAPLETVAYLEIIGGFSAGDIVGCRRKGSKYYPITIGGMVLGKATADIGPDSNGSVTVYYGTQGSETDIAAHALSGRNRSGLTIPLGTWLLLAFVDRSWEIVWTPDITACGTLDSLDEETAPDYILGLKDGCLVKVPVSTC